MADVPLRFALLGRLRAWRGDAEVPLGPGRQRALLAALMLSAGRPVGTDRITEFVWPRGAPDAAGALLRTYAERLATALEPDRERTGVLRPVPGGGYLLAVKADQIDLLRVRALATGAGGGRGVAAGAGVSLGAGPRADPGTGPGTGHGGRGPGHGGRGPGHGPAAGAGAGSGAAGIGGDGPAATYGFLAEAMAHIGGAPADDLDPEIRAHPWIVAAEREVLSVALAYAEAAAAGGHAKDAAERLAHVARWAPVDEPLHAALIRTLRIAGRRDDALAAYERFQRRLSARLGRAPGPDVEREYRTALSGSVSWVGRRAEGIRLVGRDGDLEALTRLLATRRCITLTGPGGVGKTALALTLAQRAATAYDLVAVAELAVLPPARTASPGVPGARPVADPAPNRGANRGANRSADPGADRALDPAADPARGAHSALLTGVVARTLAASRHDAGRLDAGRLDAGGPDAGPAAGGDIEDALRGRRVLLVLDNADHVRDGCAQLTGRLLGECPALTVLTTSRAALDLADETVWEVPALDVTAPPRAGGLAAHPAVRLFLRRARESTPETDLSERLPLVWEMCRRLGGSPLAIELAAARLGSLSLTALRDRIVAECESRPAAAADPSISGPAGRALDPSAGYGQSDAAVRWSHDLLSKAERLLLGRLAVFAGTFSVAAAEEVAAWGAIEAVAPWLERLAASGFVRSDGAGRYRLLPMIRDVALARAADGELTVARRRHQDRYLRQAEQSVGGALAEPAPVEGESSRAEAAASVEEERYDILLAIERAAEQDAGAVDRAMELVTSARGLLDRLDHGAGDLHGALRRARAALSATRESSARLTMLVGLLRQETVGPADPRVMTLHRGRLDAATRRRNLCATLINTQDAVVGSRLERAGQEGRRARDLLASADPRDLPQLPAILVDLGGLTADPESVTGLLRAVELAGSIGDPEAASAVMARAAEQLAWWGRCAEAETVLGDTPELDRHRHRVAMVDLLSGRLGIARSHAQAVAEATARPLPQRARICALVCLCWTDVLGGDPEEALRRAGHAVRAAERIEWTAVLPELHRIRAYAHWRADRPRAATAALRRGITVAAELPDPRNLLRALHLAAAVAGQDDAPAAGEIARLARTCRVKSGLRPWPLGEAEYAGWERALGVAGDPVRTTAVAVDSLILTASDRVLTLLGGEQA